MGLWGALPIRASLGVRGPGEAITLTAAEGTWEQEGGHRGTDSQREEGFPAGRWAWGRVSRLLPLSQAAPIGPHEGQREVGRGPHSCLCPPAPSSWEEDPVTSLDLENPASLVTSRTLWAAPGSERKSRGRPLAVPSQLCVQHRAGRRGGALLATGATKAAPRPGHGSTLPQERLSVPLKLNVKAEDPQTPAELGVSPGRRRREGRWRGRGTGSQTRTSLRGPEPGNKAAPLS